MKQIPNIFTLLNLIFGCIAIVFALQTGQSFVELDSGGLTDVVLPEKIQIAALFIFAAAIIDFLDGFLARLLKAKSAMGAQLDSLSDVVSFGVAPAVILYQLLRMSYAQEADGLNVSLVVLIPAFFFTAAVAWRLAKFNLSDDQSSSFRGVPSPAAGLFVASLPLIIGQELANDKLFLSSYLVNKWVIYVLILVLAWLMLNNRRFLSAKLQGLGFQQNKWLYILLIISIVSIILLKWVAVPLIFLCYLLVSFFSKPAARGQKPEADRSLS